MKKRFLGVLLSVIALSGMPGAETRTPQVGIGFNGNRLDVTARDIANKYGRRTPDSTVAQRHFRFGFVLIVPAGAAPSRADLITAAQRLYARVAP